MSNAEGQDHDHHLSRHAHSRPSSLSRGAMFVVAVGCALAIGALIFAGLVPRWRSTKDQQENREVLGNPEPQVVWVQPQAEKSERVLTLPGGLEALQEIRINARVDGYVGRWLVDIGDKVHRGQKLAIIEAPELNQRRAEAMAAVAEAQADVFQAQAEVRRISSERARLLAEEEQAVAEVGQNVADIRARRSDAEFARVSNERWQKLVKDQAISLQEADQRSTAYQAARAVVQSAQEKLLAARSQVKAARARQVVLQAEIESGQAKVRSTESRVVARQSVVDRIDSELAFCQVEAPFSGIITQRLIDVGSLVSAGGDKTTLFELAHGDRLRVFVDVPEGDAPSIAIGQRAKLRLKEFPDREFKAVVTRTSGSLDKVARTLRTQIELDNPGILNPGMHADVVLALKAGGNAVVVPSTAILVKPDGPKVLVVDEQNRVSVRDVRLGLDYGREIQILSGLKMSDKVINIPPDGLIEGSKVRPTEPKPNGDKETGAGKV